MNGVSEPHQYPCSKLLHRGLLHQDLLVTWRAPMVLLALLVLGAEARADAASTQAGSRLDAVQVTANRFADPIQEVPNSISVVTGEDLQARGVRDLAGALAQLAGITISPGGDAGSAGSSPGLLGRRETDDFLLVIDGVPAGGAFTPQFSTLNLHSVERIEVIRGTAPVYYGTTAFAGTINVVHYAAGRGPAVASVTVGSFGTVDVAMNGVLSDGTIRQSLSIDGTQDQRADPRASFRRVHALYRAATQIADGDVRLDLDLTDLHDKPASPTPFSGTTALLPNDFNQNPANGHINTQVSKLTAAYDRALGAGQWTALLSLTHTHTDTTQGFLDSGFGSETGTNAAGYDQGRSIDDLFFDTHVTQGLAKGLDITYGLNILDGELTQASRQFNYLVPFDGTAALPGNTWATTDNTTLGDHRTFYGAYAQSRWKVTQDVNLLAGLRWNHTVEKRDGYGDQEGFDHEEARTSRLSGSLGANWWVWKDASGDLDDLSLYANVGNTFQPPQVDFGPDAQIGAILKPEFLQSAEVGAKADGLDGRLDLDLSIFFIRFNNRPLNTTINNQPAVVAGGMERFKGFELEGHYTLVDDLRLVASYAQNSASYGDFQTQLDGAAGVVQLSGNRIEYVPTKVAGFGVTFTPKTGWQGAFNAQYVGPRFLDPQGQASVGGFMSLGVQGGYRWRDWSVQVSGENLGDRRDPVLASELGAGQAYRMNGRRLLATLIAQIH